MEKSIRHGFFSKEQQKSEQELSITSLHLSQLYRSDKCATQNDQNSLMFTNKYFWCLLVFRGMSFVSVFSKLLSYWKTVLLDLSEVGWTLAGTTVSSRGRTHHRWPGLELELQVAVVVLDCRRLCYVLRSRLWDYRGRKQSLPQERYLLWEAPIESWQSWELLLQHTLSVVYLLAVVHVPQVGNLPSLQ